MEGCSKFCTYCIVPYTRGDEVSRPLADVLAEAAALTAQGVKEINLLGQNVNAYRGVMPDGDTADLAFLIETLAEMPGIERLRYTTSHPREMNQRLIDLYQRVPKLVSHLHLPVQAGSDRVLAAMKRGYTVLEYKSLVRRLRAARPDISLSSDFIVGFPGETEDEFEKTMTLIEEVGFDASFSFIFSPRPGTPAAEMADDTPADREVGSTDAPAKAHRRAWPWPFRSAWSAACSGCWSSGTQRRTPTNFPRAPTTTAWSIFPARRG